MVIKNVTKFSLVGSISGQTNILCIKNEVGILIAYSNNIRIENIAVKNCSYTHTYKYRSKAISSNLMIVMCEKLFIKDATFLSSLKKVSGLSIHDPIGLLALTQIESNSILIYIEHITANVDFKMSKFSDIPSIAAGYAVSIVLNNHLKNVSIKLSQMEISSLPAILIDSRMCTGSNTINIYKLNLKSYEWPQYTTIKSVITFNFTVPCTSFLFQNNVSTNVQFGSCEFVKMDTDIRLIYISINQNTPSQYPYVTGPAIIGHVGT